MNISNINEYLFPIIYTCIYYNPPMNPYNLQQSFYPVGGTMEPYTCFSCNLKKSLAEFCWKCFKFNIKIKGISQNYPMYSVFSFSNSGKFTMFTMFHIFGYLKIIEKYGIWCVLGVWTLSNTEITPFFIKYWNTTLKTDTPQRNEYKCLQCNLFDRQLLVRTVTEFLSTVCDNFSIFLR